MNKPVFRPVSFFDVVNLSIVPGAVTWTDGRKLVSLWRRYVSVFDLRSYTIDSHEQCRSQKAARAAAYGIAQQMINDKETR